MKKILIVVAIILVAYLTTPWIQRHFFPSLNQLGLTSYITSGHVTRVVMLDLTKEGNFSHNEFLKGNNAIIVMTGNSQDPSHLLINGQAVLSVLDRDSNGHIDPRDPIFSRLALMVVRKDKPGEVSIMPLFQAGVRTIALQKEAIKKPILDEDHLNYIEGSVVMSDGSVHLIKDVMIYEVPKK